MSFLLSYLSFFPITKMTTPRPPTIRLPHKIEFYNVALRGYVNIIF